MADQSENGMDAQFAWEDDQIRGLVTSRPWASLLPGTGHPVWIHAPASDPAAVSDALARIARAGAEVDRTPRPELGMVARLFSSRRRREHRDEIDQWHAPYTRECERAGGLVRPLGEDDELASANAVLAVDPAAEATVHDLLWRMAHHDSLRMLTDGTEQDAARRVWLELVVSYEKQHAEVDFEGPL
ncbi:MAG: hypothetical protein ACTHV2_07970 [Brachybacterium sp.]